MTQALRLPQTRPAADLTNKAQIGRCGEILVQYQLLKHRIESAAMTTDDGVDLVAYSPNKKRALTIQVKANWKPKRAGGRGSEALDWWISRKNPAQLIALVNLSLDKVWLFTQEEMIESAQQRSSGRLHFYFYTDPKARPRRAGGRERDYVSFELSRRVTRIFGLRRRKVRT